MADPVTYTKQWEDGPERATALGFHRYAAAIGLAPQIVAEDETTVTFYKLSATLNEWCEGSSAQERTGMSDVLLQRLDLLHVSGLCHRDLHADNVMVDHSGTPFFIDFELAIWVSPHWPCYDIAGSNAFIPVPQAHAEQARHEQGIWWGPTVSRRCLVNVLGPRPQARHS